MRVGCPLEDIVSAVVTATSGANTSGIAAQGAGIKTYLHQIIVFNNGASNGSMIITDGSGGTTKIKIPFPASTGTTVVLPLYRIDSLLTKMNSLQHPTPENLGEVWSTQTKLTYMGTAKSSIVAAGQWAYDPTGSGGQGTLWVRAALDQDLSISANTRVVSVFDWRCLLDEIVICYIDEAPTGNAQKWRRLTKVYSRTSGPGASETSWTPRASLSPDGRFVIFCSTWGDRSRRDIFAVVMTPDTGIGQTFQRIPQGSRVTMTESLRVPQN